MCFSPVSLSSFGLATRRGRLRARESQLDSASELARPLPSWIDSKPERAKRRMDAGCVGPVGPPHRRKKAQGALAGALSYSTGLSACRSRGVSRGCPDRRLPHSNMFPGVQPGNVPCAFRRVPRVSSPRRSCRPRRARQVTCSARRRWKSRDFWSESVGFCSVGLRGRETWIKISGLQVFGR